MKNKNSGFSLFTVLIAVAFLSIMGLLLLYISVANFEIQTTDLKGKDSFYTAEQALEEIRTGLQEYVGEAMSEAYLYVMENYSADDSSTEESLDDQRQTAFTEKYLTVLTRELSGTVTTVSGDSGSGGDGVSLQKTYDLEKLKKFVDLLTTTDTDVFDPDKETLEITSTNCALEVGTESGVLLKNIKVVYVDERGRSSIIQTDIRLGIPNIEFPTPSTLPDLMNMIVVADGGIEVCSATGSTAAVTIDGSVYAGLITTTDTNEDTDVSIEIEAGQELKISSGDQVVCEGGILANQGSTFTAASSVNLWASGITLSGSLTKVELLGKTYIADDLTVESGSGSTVKLSGGYYGYGSPDTARDSHNNYNKSSGADPAEGETGVLDGVSNSSLSSSIIINGTNTTLDLSGLDELMLAGETYVGISASDGALTSSDSDVLMGESVTVKGTQLAYLLPSSLLVKKNSNYKETLTNPMSADQYEESGIQAYYEGNNYTDTSGFVDMETKLSEWGNQSLSDIGVDTENPVKVVFYPEGNETYVYFYLNFEENSTKAAAFMQTYYKQNSEALDEYLTFYFKNEGTGITLKDPETYLRFKTAGNYIVSGNILTYKSGAGNLLSGSEESLNLSETQEGYQNMWFTLNRKMIGSYDLLETEVDNSAGTFDHSETDARRSVYDNLVNENAMLEFVYASGTQTAVGEDATYYVYRFTDEETGLGAIFADNSGEGGTVTITTTDAETKEKKTTTKSRTTTGVTIEIGAEDSDLRLVVCTGDVRIKSGVTFNGIIMTKGKIILEAGATLQSNATEAAQVFQAQIGEDQVESRDFFWDGDDYVLGSGSSSDTTSSSSSQSETYDISDAITYENWKKM